MRQTISTFDNGALVIVWPDKLSSLELSEIEELFAIQMRIFRRQAQRAEMAESYQEAAKYYV